MSRGRWRGLAVAAALAAGCYAPRIGDGDLLCTDAGQCPRGLRCGLDGLCWRNPDGHAPADRAPGDAAADAAADRAAAADRGAAADGSLDARADSAAEAGAADRPAADDAPAAADRPAAPDARDAARKILGASCVDASECVSGFCADGVCCQSACAGGCQACNLTAGPPGVCASVAAGAASPPGHPACAETPAAGCQSDGRCDGRGACRRYAGDVCAGARCDTATGSIVLESRCDGQGACLPGPATSCAPFRCRSDGTACIAICASTSDCVSGSFCTAGSCGPKPRGAPCAAGPECSSGLCVDGVCCDAACAGQCEACDLPSAPGTCSPVTSGPPHGGRAACGGAGACAGSCAAVARTACTFPNGVPCSPQSCAGSTLTVASSCNGAGACPAGATRPCAGGLACNDAGTACLAGCRGDADCVAPATPYCAASACTAARPNGIACSTGADCQSGACVDGRCCNLPCGGTCEACDVGGHLGACWPIPAGQAPHGARAGCGGTAECAGLCNGASNQCAFPGPETQCNCRVVPLGGTCNRAGQCTMLGNLCI